MRINRIKKKMKNGEPVFGIMIKEARNINIAEILEIAGFDYFVIDMEHAYYDMSDITEILQFARKTEITSVVRIPRLDYAYVAKTLDMGAEGIWVPHLDTVEAGKRSGQFREVSPRGDTRRGGSCFQTEGAPGIQAGGRFLPDRQRRNLADRTDRRPRSDRQR